MAIADPQLKLLQAITADLAECINTMHPVTNQEWALFDRVVHAHRILRNADLDSLVQLHF